MAETTEQYRTRINQIKTSIEQEPAIRKMRDDIAEGVSKTGNRQADIEIRQDTLEDDFIAVQTDASNASPSGAEVAVARGGHSTLDERLTTKEQEVTAQFAQKDEQLAQKASITYLDAILIDIAKGGPKGYFTSITALKAKYPDATGADGTWLVFDASFGASAHSFLWDSENKIWKNLGAYQANEVNDYTITPKKTTFIYVSPNLFDKKTVKYGELFTGTGSDMNTFTKTDNQLERHSNIMPVVEGVTYKSSSKTTDNGSLLVLFKADGSYLRGLSGTDNADGTYSYLMSVGAKYAGINYSGAVVNEEIYMFTKASEWPTGYISCGDKLDKSLIADTTDQIENMSERVTELENVIVKPTEYDGDEVFVFLNGLTIGSSLTQGTFNTNAGTYELLPMYSYPAYFTKLTNVSMTNMGDGGITLKRWWERNNTKDWTGQDFAVIEPGVNDVIQGVLHSEVTQYLQIIVDKLKSDNAGIKIFITTIMPATSYTGAGFDSMSQSIRDFVSPLSDEDVYLIDLAKYGHTKDSEAYNNGHLSALGYLQLAKDIKSYIAYIINQNKLDFRNVQFTGTDKSY